MRRVALVFGTRPEAIKLAPVERRLREVKDVDCLVCVTGQHREMLDQVLAAFDIRVDADLEVMRPRQDLADLTARILESVERWFAAERPDLVLVQGDTTTAFAAALAAFYRRIPVGHVEAGLRTRNLAAPWPEEANRQLVGRLADLHFAPTERARGNLLAEAVPADRIHVTGNTIVDAVLLARHRVLERSPEVPGLPRHLLEGRSDLVLITGHRRESFGAPIEAICGALARLAAAYPETAFVYPVHLNPNVTDPVQRILGTLGRPNVFLIEPLEYLPFVRMMMRSRLIISDSGGIQEEAPTLGVPVLVTRAATERPEAVECGVAQLVGSDAEKIVATACSILDAPRRDGWPLEVRNPFGDGRAAERIVDVCLR